MKVTMTHPTTGDVRNIKVGFSWTGFFFGWLPLFFRGLWQSVGIWFGSIIFGMFIIVALSQNDTDSMSLPAIFFFSTFFTIIINCIVGGLFTGFMLNRWTARGLLKRGYTIEHKSMTLEDYAKGMT